MRHEFSEVLTDWVDYFLVGDIQLLESYKQAHGLPDDLAYEFTHGDSGDQAVREGVVLPLAGVDNLPYRILFTLDGDPPALRQPGSRLKHQRSGYVLRVENRALMLFTWRILQHFTPKTLGDLLARYQEPGRPIIELDNGWYDVEVLAGAVVREGLYEPAFEFVLNKRWSRGEAAQVDIGYAFTLRGYFD
ncbi:MULTISPECIES: hypothetical protein [Pseudomonas]|uniref:DUF4166 domain-containing protein n=1 Tax=Pseudomonas taiwanensis TaxID=470150 RepID=A0ABR6V1U7_9PSED|nr:MULTISPECIES: hypothetical protein [Pseudomonas]AGZ35553.1 hypothetical protein PVLB_13835 [Pseudomonas sp. VLB120]AVD90154.1 hypothetical protein C4Q26_24730 [Pseudomonas sp. SWI44]MBC3474495.1 hypothetical protein [Pseudomonas taiwanensis]MBC3489572.1 hypothetical protein [Pseudomonas taiwanensis]MDT8921423.1 hypothetical protein [Pseudomonas taiwanensis]